MYKQLLDLQLSKITDLLAAHCGSVHCLDISIHYATEAMCNDIIESYNFAGNTSVQASKTGHINGQKCIPGWNEYVLPRKITILALALDRMQRCSVRLNAPDYDKPSRQPHAYA